MVTVYGPMQGFQAAGTIAQAVTFARRGRSTTAYAKTRPHQPRTPSQVARRIMFSFLGSQWSSLAGVDQQTWLPKFGAPQPTALLHYMSVNLARWTSHLGPSKVNPPTEATTPGKLDSFTATGKTGYVDILFRQLSPHNAWGWTLYRSQTTPFTPGPQNLVAIWPVIGAGFIARTDGPLAAGTYYYYLGNFSPDGKLLVWTGPRTATVL